MDLNGQNMASKVNIPVNNLGSYLTKNDKLNIDIYARTQISTVELSKLRSGLIKSLDARKLFLIIKAAELNIEDALIQIYPNLKLTSKDGKASSVFNNLYDFFEVIEKYTLQKVASDTGISIVRLRNIKNNKVHPLAHELFLIELATDTKPGTLFKVLFGKVKLSSKELEMQLRTEEKIRSSKRK